MNAWDTFWSWLPWPLNPTGMFAAIVWYCLAIASGWVLGWLFVIPVLRADDDAFNRLLAENNEAWAQVEILTALLAATESDSLPRTNSRSPGSPD